MNILIYSQHFWPEKFRINDVALELSKKNNIFVISSWPNYNYKSKKKIFRFGFERYKNLKIIRVPTIRRKRNTNIEIILNYLSYIIGCFFIKNKIFNNVKFDVVISYATSPIYQAIPAIIFSKKRGIKFFLWVQDLWPGVLKDLNIIRNKLILKFLNFTTNLVYKNSDYILAQSVKFKNIIKRKNKNTFLFYNPSDIKKFEKLRYYKGKYKKITFAGNIGRAQALENLIIYAKYIKKNNLPIIFELIGEGSNKKNLINLVKKYNLNKIIIFRNFMEAEKLSKYLRSSNGLLVCLNEGEALSSTLPAKFQTYIAYGKPIFTFKGNIVSNLINKHKIGFTLAENNFKDVIKRFLKMKNSEIKKIHFESKNLFNNFFEIKNNVKNLENFLLKKSNEK